MKTTLILLALIVIGSVAFAEEKGCAVADQNFDSSLKEFRLAKGFYCQAYVNCGTAFGHATTMVNIDLTLSVPGGDDPAYDSCMAPYIKQLNDTAKNLTAWELARCEERAPEADIYYLCGSEEIHARGGTANRYLAPLPLRTVANR